MSKSEQNSSNFWKILKAQKGRPHFGNAKTVIILWLLTIIIKLGLGLNVESNFKDLDLKKKI